jgi:hypothetical protein
MTREAAVMEDEIVTAETSLKRQRVHVGGIGHASSDFLPRSILGCGKEYRRHPDDPYRFCLTVLCDGKRVKL